ncbi:hypothetical protein XELAEV_18008626mg [Xenopus laevis]|uniref:Uncharacterized protein n=1 Tax=Xenopus laevis TaxID=8355 RepID=A0A974E385_XENLA|nr:hypothetical protein XELAEV_18008626mg [Xenopus laevis]
MLRVTLMPERMKRSKKVTDRATVGNKQIPLSERILSVTLEIVYLLTGQVSSTARNTGDTVSGAETET